MQESKLPRTVGDIMTRALITLKPSDNLVNIEEGMKRFRFRHLPVVDDQTKLVGLITHRDMLAASSSIFSSDAERRNKVIHEKGRAEMLMRKDVVSVTQDASLVHVSELMWDRKIGCVCVVDDGAKLIGIVTDADFVKLAGMLLRDMWDGSMPPPPGLTTSED